MTTLCPSSRTLRTTATRVHALVGAVIMLMLLSACGGGAPERSASAFCERLDRFWVDLAAEDRAAGDSPADQLALLLGQTGEFTRLLSDLAETAPEEIRGDVEASRDTIGHMIDRATQISGGSLDGLLMSGASQSMQMLMFSMMGAPAFARVDRYAQSECGSLVFGGIG